MPDRHVRARCVTAPEVRRLEGRVAAVGGLLIEATGPAEALKLGARPANHEHGHDHTVRGLVLAGVFTVICGGKPRTYRPGEIFEVGKGVEHSEEIGSEGAEVIVGRKF